MSGILQEFSVRASGSIMQDASVWLECNACQTQVSCTMDFDGEANVQLSVLIEAASQHRKKCTNSPFRMPGL